MTEPPGADPHARWCGRGAVSRPPIPIIWGVQNAITGSTHECFPTSGDGRLQVITGRTHECIPTSGDGGLYKTMLGAHTGAPLHYNNYPLKFIEKEFLDLVGTVALKVFACVFSMDVQSGVMSCGGSGLQETFGLL